MTTDDLDLLLDQSTPATGPALTAAETRTLIRATRREATPRAPRAIERLGSDLAELIRLVHWDGFTVAEAGEILGVPETTARSRYRRAKEQLRAALAARVP